MPNTALGHDGNGDGLFDLDNEFRVTHASHATLGTNVGGHALQRHDRCCPGVFSEASLFGVDYIADYSTFEHFWEIAFNLYRSNLLLHDYLSPVLHGIFNCLTTFYHIE